MNNLYYIEYYDYDLQFTSKMYYHDIITFCKISGRIPIDEFNKRNNKYNIFYFPNIYFPMECKNTILNNSILTFYKLKHFDINFKLYLSYQKYNIFKLYLHNDYTFEQLFFNNKITIEEIKTIKSELLKIKDVFLAYEQLDVLYFFNKSNAKNFIISLNKLIDSTSFKFTIKHYRDL